MRFRVIIFTGLGFIFLGAGAIGLLLPVWPTTPFVLLAAACFSHIPPLRDRIMQITFFREYIESYKEKKGLSRKTVIISLSYLWGMLTISMFVVKTPWVPFLLAFIGIAVTCHIIWVSRIGFRRGKEKK